MILYHQNTVWECFWTPFGTLGSYDTPMWALFLWQSRPVKKYKIQLTCKKKDVICGLDLSKTFQDDGISLKFNFMLFWGDFFGLFDLIIPHIRAIFVAEHPRPKTKTTQLSCMKMMFSVDFTNIRCTGMIVYHQNTVFGCFRTTIVAIGSHNTPIWIFFLWQRLYHRATELSN